MSIVKAFAVFIFTSLIVFAVSMFIPKYHEVTKDQLQSLVSQIKYTEGQENTTDIDNVLDTIPVKAALLFKNQVISSNISKTDRVSQGESNLLALTKNVPADDLVLKYKEDDPAYKSMGFIIPVFTGLICGIIFLFMNRAVETTSGASQSMREEIERLQTINEMYQQKEDEFSKKIDKQIPDNLEEAQKLLKSMLKEKEVIVTEMDRFNEKEEDFRKDIINGKMQLNKQKEVNNGLENKIRELQNQLSGADRQEKQMDDLKAKIEKGAADLKEYKLKLRTYEKTDIDAIKAETSELKSKLADSEAEIKSFKEEIKSLKKIDPEKLQSDMETGNLEKEELKKELRETKQQLRDFLAGLEGTDAGQLKLENFEYQKTIKNLQKELNDARDASQSSEPGSDPNTLILLREKETELENVQIELKMAREMVDSLKNGVSPDVIASLEDKQVVATLAAKVQQLQEDLNNKASNDSASAELEEQLREKDEQISQMRKQLINRELEVKRLKSDAGASVSDFNLEEFEADLQKSKNLALKYKKERDDRIKNINSLNAAFESANEALRRKEEELDQIDEKYRNKISEVKSQMDSQTFDLKSLNDKYRSKIDELKALAESQAQELNRLKLPG